MINKVRTLFTLLLFLLVLFTSPAFAKIALQPDFQGTVVITFANGEISLIEPGDAVPDIPSSGATMEVFDGHFTVMTQEGDSVQLSALDHLVTVANGASATLTCSEESCVLKVLSGSVELANAAGIKTTLAAGTEQTIQAGEAAAAPATAAGEPTGGAPAGGSLAEAPPADSRNIQSSPSQ